jgi:hypothetical protein
MPLQSADESLITEMFRELSPEIEKYFEGSLHYFAQESIKALAVAWAKEIIYILVHKTTLKPRLRKSTIERRKRRDKGEALLGYDYPLVETGMWTTFIEFRIHVENDRYILEVGVYDDATKIGHRNSKTPAWLAIANEYGVFSINKYNESVEQIPGRYFFTTSEARVYYKIDDILAKTWTKIDSSLKLDKKVTAYVVYGQSPTFQAFSTKGRIAHNGATFVFQWDEEYQTFEW